jgi:hypothetical protein
MIRGGHKAWAGGHKALAIRGRGACRLVGIVGLRVVIRFATRRKPENVLLCFARRQRSRVQKRSATNLPIGFVHVRAEENAMRAVGE